MARPHLLERWGARAPVWTRIGRAPPVELRFQLNDVQLACDRLFHRVASTGSWRDLRDCSTELRFLVLHSDRLVELARHDHGDGPEVRVACSALERVRHDLASAPPASRYALDFTPSCLELRNSLYDALWHLRYALLVLGWVRLDPPRYRVSAR
jgi:hypothetical protein